LETLDIASIKFDPESERMAEMKMFQDMLTVILSRIQRANVAGIGAVDGLADSFGQLSVSR
jgi:hypothetical protein